MKRIIATLLLFSLLFATGCSKGPTLYEKAQDCVGASTDYLREQIGLPEKIYYSNSPLGNSMQGELVYSGFTVYTNLDYDGKETVTDVVENNDEQKSDYEIAQSYIGKPLSELQELIGLPNNLRYANSCLGEGEDGELYYRSFTVYTYRETDGTETVYDVVSK